MAEGKIHVNDIGVVLQDSHVSSVFARLSGAKNGEMKTMYMPWRMIDTSDGLEAYNTFVYAVKNDSVLNAIAINIGGQIYRAETTDTTWTRINPL